MALAEGLWYLNIAGIAEDSRNGPVVVAPNIVVTEYGYPAQRVLFSPIRNANPFFHLMESLWMLGGRRDLAWIHTYNKRFLEFADDGMLHGAYGYRWRRAFFMDQLPAIINLLKKDPQTRRAVLAMWSAPLDLNREYKDIPCNTHVYFDLRNGVLNMTVCCRSNDVWWGAYGANAVHFSILQEYIAAGINSRMGVYRQVSNNYHIYTDIVPREAFLETALDADMHNHYRNSNICSATPIVNTDVSAWDRDLDRFIEDPLGDAIYMDSFFNEIAVPMAIAWDMWKNTHNATRAIVVLQDNMPAASDWRLGCVQWLERR